jgi:hypothetical protein
MTWAAEQLGCSIPGCEKIDDCRAEVLAERSVVMT